MSDDAGGDAGAVDPRREAVRALFGPAQAEAYDAVWSTGPVWGTDSRHHLAMLSGLVRDDLRWLDAGCGTGWYLSKFPGVERAGFDLSPAMVEQATRSNPDALFLREHDLVVDVPEWHGQWDLVTCMGHAWSYLRSMDEIRRFVANVARWTRPDGVVVIPVGDLTDLNGCRLDYDFSGERPAPGTTRITGAIWSRWEEEAVHADLIVPSLDVWVGWLAEHFAEVEVVHWEWDPPRPVIHTPCRTLVARGTRPPGSTARARIVYEAPDLDARPGGGRPSPPPTPAVGTAEDTRAPASPAGGQRIPGRPLVDQPLSYLIGQVRPWDPRFWRAVERRARPAVGRVRSRVRRA